MVFPDNFGALTFDGHTASREVRFSNTQCAGLSFVNAELRGGIFIEVQQAKVVDLSKATVSGPTVIRVHSGTQRILMSSATFSESVELSLRSVVEEFPASETRFERNVSVEGGDLHNVDWSNTTFRGDVSFRARLFNLHVVRASFHGDVSFQGSYLDGPMNLHGASFAEGTVLDLTDVRCPGLALTGRHLPSEIRVQGTTFVSPVTMQADLGGRVPRITARGARPEFLDTATFTNVNLRECLLVGNNIWQIQFYRVIWARKAGRQLLYDEAVSYGRDEHILPGILEAYQVLKKKAQEVGDEALAGDFHYGELEMRRHIKGPIGSILCLEFLYWLLSGYGTRPWRALFALMASIVGAALLYLAFGEESGLVGALRYSAAVATLQTRETATSTSWIRVVQLPTSAVLIALLVLAVRMRLKR